MAKTKYNEIYMALREKMEDGTYGFQELLPSENTLVKEFDCSRNTIAGPSGSWRRKDTCRVSTARE